MKSIQEMTNNFKISLSWPTVLIIAVLVKGFVLASWSTALELAAVLAFAAWYQYLQPKPVTPASEEDVNHLSAELKNLRAEMTQVKMFFGFNPAKKFSMFEQKAKP